ncbi:MAG: hypothetical protein HY292_28710 [Planctomycetes bacterium]|nr:hypothetical protein [Planctomycetota bacterium]
MGPSDELLPAVPVGRWSVRTETIVVEAGGIADLAMPLERAERRSDSGICGLRQAMG